MRAVVLSLLCPSLCLALEPLEQAEGLLKLDAPRLALEAFEAGVIKNQAETRTYLLALARTGQRQTLWREWDLAVERFPELADDHLLLEDICWCVLAESRGAAQPMARAAALVGAVTTRDVLAVDYVLSGLQDSNLIVRALSAELAAQLGDQVLRRRLLDLLPSESSTQVRLAMLRSIGMLGERAALHTLERCVQEASGGFEEQAMAAQSLATIAEELSEQQLHALVSSRRTALRLLACFLVDVLDQEALSSQIEPLLSDHHPWVRASAVIALSHLQPADETRVSQWLEMLDEGHGAVVCSAGRALIQLGHPEGGRRLLERIDSGTVDQQREAAIALASSGEGGVRWMEQAFDAAADTTARMNLAMGLIHQRAHSQTHVNYLAQQVAAGQARRQWRPAWGQKWIDDQPPLSREGLEASVMTDQMLRLEVFSVLCTVAPEAMMPELERFLTRQQWGISGTAATVLLQEGMESVVEVVEQLADSTEPRVRLQAALILAFWGRDSQALNRLMQEYPSAPRPIKEFILGSLGRMGEKETLPFLREQLRSPHQLLRVMAAAAAIEVINS